MDENDFKGHLGGTDDHSSWKISNPLIFAKVVYVHVIDAGN